MIIELITNPSTSYLCLLLFILLCIAYRNLKCILAKIEAESKERKRKEHLNNLTK